MDIWKDVRPRGLGIMPLNNGNSSYKRKGVMFAEDNPKSMNKVRKALEKQFALKSEVI